MSTRGAVGFRKDNKDYVLYNHCDSYPEHLGECVIKFIKETDISQLHLITNTLFKEDFSLLPSFLKNPNKDDETESANAEAFLLDSLFCEYAYIINLDTQELEFYKGFNKFKLSHNGRYADKMSESNQRVSTYYGVVLAKTLSFSTIHTKSISELVLMLTKRAEKMRQYLNLLEAKQQECLTSLLDEAISTNISELYFSFDKETQLGYLFSLTEIKELAFAHKNTTTLNKIKTFTAEQYAQIAEAICKKTDGYILRKEGKSSFVHVYNNLKYYIHCFISPTDKESNTNLHSFYITIEHSQKLIL